MLDDLPIPKEEHDHDHEEYRSRYGPGHWDYMHRCAANADEDNRKEFIVDMLNMECISFGCKNCRNDFTILWLDKYAKRLSHYWTRYYKLNGKTYDVGMLLLTVDLHNEVNEKLGKRIMSYDAAIKKYLFDACDDFVCTDH